MQCLTLLASAVCMFLHAGKTVPEDDLKALLEEDTSEEALQEEKETEIMLDCNEKFNEVCCVLPACLAGGILCGCVLGYMFIRTRESYVSLGY